MSIGPFELLFAIFLVVFLLAAVGIAIGFFTTLRLTGKMFQAVERELDRKASDQSATPSTPVASKLTCAHCGTATSAEKCPNCGATIANV